MFSCSAPSHRRQGFYQVRDDAARQAATRRVVQEGAHFQITPCDYIVFTMLLQSFPFRSQCVCNRLHNVDIAFTQTPGFVQKRCKTKHFLCSHTLESCVHHVYTWIQYVHIALRFIYIPFTVRSRKLRFPLDSSHEWLCRTLQETNDHGRFPSGRIRRSQMSRK